VGHKARIVTLCKDEPTVPESVSGAAPVVYASDEKPIIPINLAAVATTALLKAESEDSTLGPDVLEKSSSQTLSRVPETFAGFSVASNEATTIFTRNLNVIVENTYEMYDPTTRRRQVLEMTNQVVHVRPWKRLGKGLDDGTGSARLSAGSRSSACSVSSYGWVSETSSRASSPGPSPRPPSTDEPNGFAGSIARASTADLECGRSNVELTTKWGVFVCKLIFCRISMLNTLAYKAISRTRRQKWQSVNVWTGVQGRARRVVEQAKLLARKVVIQQEDVLDPEWQEYGLLPRLFGTEYVDTLMILAKAARKLLASQPVLATAAAPCRIFGDIHGQLRDLLFLFSAFGVPGESIELSHVFNGDFVDRGSHQIEVIGLLFALKVTMPEKVWLVRGNHEDRSMNEKYGFKDTCSRQLGKEFGLLAYELFEEAFDQLPVACLINESILCVHGGIGDGRWDLNDLRAVQRPLGEQELADPQSRWILNILWSDPIEDDQSESAFVFGVHRSERIDAAHVFGWNVTKTFCARNGLGLVVRSHQSKQDSPGFDVMHDNMLIRVFSARDYEGHGNDGAVLLVTPSMDENRKEILTVQPQVLRSVVRAREEGHPGPTLKKVSSMKRRSGRVSTSTGEDLVKPKRLPKNSSGAAPRLNRLPSSDGKASRSLTA